MSKQECNFFKRLFAGLLCVPLLFTTLFAPIKARAMLPAIPGVVVAVAKPVGYYAMIMAVLKGIEQAGNSFESIFGSSVYEFWKENFVDEESYGGFVDGLDSTEAVYTADGFIDVSLPTPFVRISSRGEVGPNSSSPSASDAFLDRFVLTSMSGTEAVFTCISNESYDTPLTYIFTDSFVWTYPTSTYSVDFTIWPWDSWRSSNYCAVKTSLMDLTTGSNVTVNTINRSGSVSDSLRSSFWSASHSFTLTQGHEYCFAYLFRRYNFSVASSYRFEQGVYPVVKSVYSGTPNNLIQPSGIDSSSRPTSLMEVITEWNIDNSISDNSTTVNYYIMPTGTDDFYNPALYDEEELVYTDPVTGTEYLTNGWTYDYLTRCYTLDMADGFTIGDAAIDTIKLTYGDELLTVDHYSGGSLIRSDEYNYVMASGSECGLNGHSYTYENVKDPTCTTMGERKYTCSVCGDEYAENVPASGHTHVFSILKEATCTAAGIGLYCCSSCGSEYTESIPATNHTGQLLETVPSEFDENGILISRGYSVYECSVCGTQYTVQDEIPVEDENWFSFLMNSITSLIKSAITAIAGGLTKIFSGFVDLIGGIFGFVTDAVLSGIKNFFAAFSPDGELFEFFQNDETQTMQLPSGVGNVYQLFSSMLAALPVEIKSILFTGIAALILIAVFKMPK